MRKWIVRIALFVVVIAAILVSRATVFAPKPILVRVIEVEKGRVESTVTNSKAGTVKARRRAAISPEVGGRVTEILFHKGDTVHEGDLIVRLNDDAQKARLEHSRRALAAARSSYEQACVRAERDRRALERNEKLAEEKVIPVDLLDEIRSQFEISARACESFSARVAVAEAEVVVAEAELRMTEIRAPFDGVLAEFTVQLGEWITPSPPMMIAPTVIDLIDPASNYISAPMDEVDSAVIRNGGRARVTIDPYPGREFPGTVVRVAPFVLDIEEQNRTVEIEVELDDAEFASSLLPGTSADVEILLEVREDVTRIPSSALVEGSKVFVIEQGRIAERSVVAGLKNWEYVEIREGLVPGEKVITSLDRPEVKPGARAEIESEDAEGR
jgi:HlyD family secretion protein